MKYRSLLAATGALLTSAVVLAGCSAPADSGGATTISFFYVGESTELAAKQQLVKDFEADNPDIKIDETYVTGTQADPKLQTYFSSNTAPDVIQNASPGLDAYAPLGVFEDLTPYVERDGLTDAWAPDLVAALTKNEQLLAAPWGWKGMAIAYNKSVFDAAGVAYPTKDWTEDDFLAAAKALTGSVDGQDVVGFDPGSYLDWGIRNMYGDPNYDIASGTMTATENPSYKHGLDLISDLVEKGESVIPGSGAASSATFVGGQVAMQIVGSWDPAAYDKSIGDNFAWDLINLPSDSKFGAWTAPAFVDGIAISSKSSEKDAAWELVKYLTTNEKAEAAVRTFAAPALQTAAATYLTEFADGETPYNRAAFSDTKLVPWTFSGIWAEVNTEERALLDSVLAGALSVDEMISQLQTFGEPLLAGTGTGQ